MSTARPVPETWNLTGGDGPLTIARAFGVRRLLVDAARRMRVADGFSHARSLAFIVSLIAIQGVIAIVGLATVFGREGLGKAARQIVGATAPGAVGSSLTTAIDQARATGRSSSFLALVLVMVGSLISATTGMAQVQRSLNRIYGVEQDRPTPRKYAIALLSAITAGVVIAAAFVCIALGRSFGESIGDNVLTPAWGILRVPLGFVLAGAAVTTMFRWSPDRHQPGWGWIAVGSGVAVLLWTLSTVALSVAFELSPSFGDAYGPLAGIVALLLWSLLSSTALLYGAAVAAQLEAVRARPAPASGPIHVARERVA